MKKKTLFMSGNAKKRVPMCVPFCVPITCKNIAFLNKYADCFASSHPRGFYALPPEEKAISLFCRLDMPDAGGIGCEMCTGRYG